MFKSVPIEKPKVGDVLAWQHWTNMDGSPTHLGHPFFCLVCNDTFIPVVQRLKEATDD